MPSVAAASRLLGRLHRKEVGKERVFYHAFDLAYHELQSVCSEAPLSCCVFSWDGENPPSHSPDGPTAKTAMEETKTSRDNAREASWEQIR